ncbi:MAG TPA: hypothetical protein DDW50_17965, partial [Firmicutes bacterium]|nr:hypothetical protein [Bacillota bacterium]
MRMKKWLTLILAVIFMFCFANFAFAFWPDNMEGEPTPLLQQYLEGYFIWNDSSGFHLKVATANGAKHIFTGVIGTDGRIENLMTQTFDPDDYSRLIDHDTLKFRLTASNQISAMNFNVWYGHSMRFELSMDGRKIDVNNIYIGRDGWHPNSAAFFLEYDEDHVDYPEHEHIIFNWWWPVPGP